MTARIENGGLKTVQDRCPQLLHEAELYRYGDAAADKQAEARWTITITRWRRCGIW